MTDIVTGSQNMQHCMLYIFCPIMAGKPCKEFACQANSFLGFLAMTDRMEKFKPRGMNGLSLNCFILKLIAN